MRAKETDRQTHRLTDTQTHRRTDGQTDRWTDRKGGKEHKKTNSQ